MNSVKWLYSSSDVLFVELLWPIGSIGYASERFNRSPHSCRSFMLPFGLWYIEIIADLCSDRLKQVTATQAALVNVLIIVGKDSKKKPEIRKRSFKSLGNNCTSLEMLEIQYIIIIIIIINSWISCHFYISTSGGSVRPFKLGRRAYLRSGLEHGGSPRGDNILLRNVHWRCCSYHYIYNVMLTSVVYYWGRFSIYIWGS